MSKVLTPARRARLEKLATYLEGLPSDYRHFDMSYWVIHSTGGGAEVKYALHNGGVTNCGTAACAAGHGPAAGVLVPPRFISKNGGVDWESYAWDLFIGDAHPALFSWLFSGSWEEIDNSHYGAAARIRYVLGHGDVPESYRWPDGDEVALYAPYRIDAKAQADA